MASVHDRYGQYVRIGYNEISTIDPEAIKILYGISSQWDKSDFYKTFKDPAGPHNLFSATNRENHSNLRRFQVAAYSMNNLLKLEESIHEQVLQRCRLIQRQNGQPIDIGRILQYLAADVVGALVFGNKTGFDLLKEGRDVHDLLQASETSNHISFLLGSWHFLGDQLWCGLAYLFGTPSNVARIIKFAKQNVNRRQSERKKENSDSSEEHTDMLDVFMRAKDPYRNGQRLSYDQVVRCSMTVLAAGSDTTSTTMQGFLMYALTTDGVMENLRQDIDDGLESGMLSWPPRYSETVKLTYFQACLKETLRMWPAVSFMLGRKAPSCGGNIGQRHFAAGTIVGIPASHFHRRAFTIFGSDADLFRPDRWLKASESQRKVMEGNFLSFGAGSRVCIGRNISMLEMSIALPMLIHLFDINLLPRTPTSPHRHARTVYGRDDQRQTWHVRSSWFAMPVDFFCRMSARPGAAELVPSNERE